MALSRDDFVVQKLSDGIDIAVINCAGMDSFTSTETTELLGANVYLISESNKSAEAASQHCLYRQSCGGSAVFSNVGPARGWSQTGLRVRLNMAAIDVPNGVVSPVKVDYEAGIAQHGRIASGCLRLSEHCLLYTSPSPRDGLLSRMPSSA